VLLEAGAVGAEGVGLDDLRASVEVTFSCSKFCVTNTPRS
jgi:hypothetical protein